MNADHYNAPFYTPRDTDDQFLELVAEYQMAGMSQDDAEIAAACKLDEIAEMAAMDAGEDAYGRRHGGDW